MGVQLSYDLSGDVTEHGFYGACWRSPSETEANEPDYGHRLADAQWEDKSDSSILYGSYDGETDITLLNKRPPDDKPGCLLRKTRLPVDLSVVGRIELDVKSSCSTSDMAPWYAVWLTPMLYGKTDDEAKAAEIDLVENYDNGRLGQDVNKVATNFAQCGMNGPYAYTRPYCHRSEWGAVATTLNHHLTVKAFEDDVDGRVIRVYRCPLPLAGSLTSCPEGSPYSEIRVTKMPQPWGVAREDWFPVWNKDIAGDHYGKYWLVADMWWTSGTDFKLSVKNVRFFLDNGTEWKMPLSGPPPTAHIMTTVETAEVVI